MLKTYAMLADIGNAIKQVQVEDNNTANVHSITDDIDIHEFDTGFLAVSVRASRLHRLSPTLSAYDAVGAVCGF